MKILPIEINLAAAWRAGAMLCAHAGIGTAVGLILGYPLLTSLTTGTMATMLPAFAVLGHSTRLRRLSPRSPLNFIFYSLAAAFITYTWLPPTPDAALSAYSVPTAIASAALYLWSAHNGLAKNSLPNAPKLYIGKPPAL
jgi:hypothetical protein